MKKIILLISLLGTLQHAIAQKTNKLDTIGNVGVGTITPTPGALLEVSSATGSATITPTTINITSTTSASDWDVVNPWGNIDFFSKDGSGTGASVRARIGAIMGTTTGSNTGLAFFTNNGTALGERVRIDNAGRVGIGLTAPGTSLDVTASSGGNGIRSLSPTGGGLLMGYPTANPATAQRLGLLGFGGVPDATAPTTYRYAAQIMAFASETWNATASGTYLTLSTTNNGATSISEKMRIDNGGNVGIGITSPVCALDVAENTLAASSENYVSRFVVSSQSKGVIVTANTDASSVVTSFNLRTAGYVPLNLGTTSAPSSIVIQPVTGNVTIGTAVAQTGYKLAVNGSAIATAMWVKQFSDWADFVFNKDYKLPVLHDLKIYIDKNHHLPDVPTEQEVLQNGLNLGKMNKVLVQKVEELTLYMIEKDKQLNEQAQKIKEQEANQQNQEKRISALEEALKKTSKSGTRQ